MTRTRKAAARARKKSTRRRGGSRFWDGVGEALEEIVDAVTDLLWWSR